MPKARSYKNEPFSGFEKQSFSVLKDDFVHEKLLTVKANVESAKGGINLKESLNKKGQSLTSTGQTKLWFFFKNNQSLYTKILPNAVTLAYDHGIQEKNNRFINWYGGVETNRNLNNNAWKLGVQVFSGKWSCNNLVQFNQNDQSLLYLHKFFSTHNNWFFNDYTTFDITRKAVNQSALLIAYKNAGQTNNDYSARFQVNGFSNLNELKTSLVDGNKLTLNWVNSQKNKYAHGVQFSSKLNKLCVSPSEFLKKLSGAFEVNMPEQSSVLKLRVDGNWTAALSLKHKLGNYGTYIWGAEVSEIGSKNNIRFGVQFDLNL